MRKTKLLKIDNCVKMFEFLFYVLPFLCLVNGDHVPVVIWGHYDGLSESPKPYALKRLGSFEFSLLLRSLTAHRPHVLLFTEHNLSVEDFSSHSDDSSFSYPNLRNISKTSDEFLYLTSVENPINVLHQLTHRGYLFSNFDEDSPPTLANPSILTVPLREPRTDEPRQSFLRAHDEDMGRISEEAVRQYGRVLALYTGRHVSFVAPNTRFKREVNEDEEPISNEIVMTDSDKMIVIVTESPIVFRQNSNISNLTPIALASTETNKKPYIALDVKFKEEEISLDWVFNSPSENHAWTLEVIKLENPAVELRSRSLISAPAGYSYFCAQDVVFTGTKDGIDYSLTLKGLQAQPRVTNNVFGPASDCVPYFSEPIWSGIMIMTLLIVVAMTAILFILDIHTNDRFDDPKGKIITMSNTE